MKLEKIIIQGFKSFYFKSEISFPAGLTAIVGPNGAGKSNISDAILWALGEQSNKTLRTSIMDEIISNGSKSYKPLSMAEVYLIFSNNDNPITIGRKLFRDGQSLYLINGESSYLKNILDLLSSLNLAPKTYTIIEQNKIQSLLDSKPIERRIYIDDAAGITRYKYKKKETINKLSAAQTNLQRITVLLDEISKNRNSLKIQASKTKKFLELQKEYKAVMQKIYSLKWSIIQDSLSAINNNYEAIKKELSSNNKKLTSINANIENLKQIITNKEENIIITKKSIDEITTKLTNSEKEIINYKNNIMNLQNDINKKYADLLTYENKLLSLNKEINCWQKESAKLNNAKINIQERLNPFLSFQNKILFINNLIKKNIEKQKQLLLQYNFESDRIANFIINNKKSLSKLFSKQEEIKKFKQYIQESLKKIIEQNHNLERIINKRRNIILQLSKLFSLLSNKIEEINNYLSLLFEKENSLNQEISIAKFYLHQLENQLYEKYPFSIPKKIIQGISNLNVSFYGILLDVIKVPSEYEQLVNFIFKDMIFSLIVKEEKDVIILQQYLKDYQKPFSILCLSLLKNEVNNTFPLNSVCLSDLIEFPKELQVMKSLLSNIFIIDNIENLKPYGELNCSIYIKKEKTFYHNSLFIKLMQPQQSENPIKLKNELHSYKTKISLLADTYASLIFKKEKIKLNKDNLTILLNNLKNLISFLQNKEKNNENLLNELNNKIKELSNKTESYKNEEFQNIMQIKNYENEIQVAETNQNLLQKEIDKSIKKTAYLENLNKLLEIEISRANSLIENTKILATKVSEKIKSIEFNLKRLLMEKNDHNLLIEKLMQQAKDEKELINDYEAKLCQAQIRIEEDLKEKENLMILLENLQSEKQAEKAKLNALEILHKKLYQEKENLIEKEHSLLIRKTQIEADGNHIKENCLRETEQAPKYYSDANEEEVQKLTSLSENLKNRIQRIGNINELAIEQYEEINKKYEFLISQQKDILESINSLEKAIQKLDSFMKIKLQEALSKINQNFQEYFSLIFKRGAIELYFEDQDKILESGLELRLKMPHKKINSFNLLSGGEKSLISLLFLFAILKYKPSCFCIWDEVDAALDESNIVKIIEIINELKKDIQFILITHNKYTMQAADQLIGISMEEEGISKILSIKLTELKESNYDFLDRKRA